MKIKCVPIQVRSPLKSIYRLLHGSRLQVKNSSIEFYLSWYSSLPQIQNQFLAIVLWLSTSKKLIKSLSLWWFRTPSKILQYTKKWHCTTDLQIREKLVNEIAMKMQRTMQECGWNGILIAPSPQEKEVEWSDQYN